MTKNEVKRLIASTYGFAAGKINLLEASFDENGIPDYVMFEVCGVEYQCMPMRKSIVIFEGVGDAR